MSKNFVIYAVLIMLRHLNLEGNRISEQVPHLGRSEMLNFRGRFHWNLLPEKPRNVLVNNVKKAKWA
jgi:hypothetical protein